ncbi:hypothetical protein GCM10011586_29400 [Silvibacterium dinghuense]|nr:hypothetical protein GCM10011586_29400 [Silvibacterium dinghuense]
MFDASYTDGKSVDDGSNLQKQIYPYGYYLRRGISSFEICHNFVATYRYVLSADLLSCRRG